MDYYKYKSKELNHKIYIIQNKRNTLNTLIDWILDKVGNTRLNKMHNEQCKLI